jgi:hypothetical protein
VSIERFLRQSDNTWILSESTDPAGSIALTTIQAVLNVEEVYEKVTFTEGNPVEPTRSLGMKKANLQDKKEYVRQVEEAKAQATRERRIAKIVEKLSAN